MTLVIGGSDLSFKHAQLKYGKREEQVKLTRLTNAVKCMINHKPNN